jgi:hypothetical protein
MDLFLEELNNGIALNDYCVTLNDLIFSVNNVSSRCAIASFLAVIIAWSSSI